MTQATKTEVDAALVQCLRILARRGRQLREERERQAAAKQEEQKQQTGQLEPQEEKHGPSF